MKNTILTCLIMIGLMTCQAGCDNNNQSGLAKQVTVMTHDSFSISQQVLRTFEQKHGIKVNFLKSGDAGAALNQALLSRKNPLADIFYGVDNTFLSRALEADLFEPYSSPLLAHIPDSLKLDPEHRLLPVDFGDVCLNYDKKWFREKGLSPPTSLEDLTKPEYTSLTVVENPATSSPGLAFLLTTIGHFGDPGYLEFWKKMKENNVLVASGWEEAYNTHFSLADKGERPIVVSYASSPAAEVHFSESTLDEAPTGVLVAQGTAFRQIEFLGLLKGAANPKEARLLIDFILDKEFQEDIPLQMFVFPANKTAQLPEIFTRHTQIAMHPVSVPYNEIAQNRDKWIRAWTEVVLR